MAEGIDRTFIKKKRPHVATHERLNTLTFVGWKELAADTVEVEFRSVKPLTFLPGQNMNLILGGKELDRKLSIVSAPHEDTIRFVFRDSNSISKQKLKGLFRSTPITAQGPRGSVTYPEKEKGAPVVALAGGVGIAPILSMLSHAHHTRDMRTFHVAYANPTEQDIAYKEELDTFAKSNAYYARTTVDYFLTRSDTEKPGFKKGYFSEEYLRQFLARGSNTIFYICGTPEMVQETANILYGKLKVSHDNIRPISFTGYTGIDDTDRA